MPCNEGLHRDSMVAVHPAQALLHWLDELNEELAFDGNRVLEEELQLAVEAALKVQAQKTAKGETLDTRRPGTRHVVRHYRG